MFKQPMEFLKTLKTAISVRWTVNSGTDLFLIKLS